MSNCTCNGEENSEEITRNWLYNGWNVTNEIHYTTCIDCGCVKRSGAHSFVNGSCGTCKIKEENIKIDDRMCSCLYQTDEAKRKNEGYGAYSGWFVSSIEHYTICKTCNKISRVGVHDFIDGKCNTCGLNLDISAHKCKYEKGICNICKKKCEHLNSDYICKTCGLKNTTAIDKLYNALLAIFPNLTKEDKAFQDLIAGNITIEEFKDKSRLANTNNGNINSYINNGVEFEYKGNKIYLSSSDVISILNALNQEIGSASNDAQIIGVLQTIFNNYEYNNNTGKDISDVIRTYYSYKYISGSGSEFDLTDELDYYENTMNAFVEVINNSPKSQEVSKVIKNSIVYGGTLDDKINNNYDKAQVSYIEVGKAYSTDGTILDTNDTWNIWVFAEVYPNRCSKCKKYISVDFYCWECDGYCCSNAYCWNRDGWKKYPINKDSGLCSNPAGCGN